MHRRSSDRQHEARLHVCGIAFASCANLLRAVQIYAVVNYTEGHDPRDQTDLGRLALAVFLEAIDAGKICTPCLDAAAIIRARSAPERLKKAEEDEANAVNGTEADQTVAEAALRVARTCAASAKKALDKMAKQDEASSAVARQNSASTDASFQQVN